MNRRESNLYSLGTMVMSTTCVAVLVACGGGDSSSPTAPTTASTPAPASSAPPAASSLQQLAATFPAMPKDIGELVAQRGSTAGTFSSGLPFNDLEYTVFDTDYIDGETNGYDTFMPVDPSLAVPGADRINVITTTGNVRLDTTYGGQRGDRIILGTAEHISPFFLRGSDGVDNDYAVITSFDYSFGHIQLKGAAADYGLIRFGAAENCKTEGWYLFHTAGAQPDLVAFIFRCDALPPLAGSSNDTPQSSKALCNATETLSLTDANQFRFAASVSSTVAVPNGQVQFGTSGKEVVGGITTDAAGNQYVVGLTDGSFTGGATADNRVFVARINADRTRGWTYELALPNGSLLWDAVTDDEFIYAVGRTLGAVPGFTSAGRWDGIILKIRLADGTLATSHQWGNEGLDGYGNVVLDDAGNLYVSAQGSPAGASGIDDQHLIARHRRSDLGNVWRQIVAPQDGGPKLVSESWGGLTYVPGSAPGQGRLVAGGWFMAVQGGNAEANGFIEVWSDLHLATPRRIASTMVASPGAQADWVLDNAVDAAGNIYAVGYTSGSLQGSVRGKGDAYIVRYDANLQNPVFRQLGTAEADAFRRLEIDAGGNLYAVGYTYGDYARSNADPDRRTGDVIVQMFDANLNSVAALQFGTPHEDRGHAHLRAGRLHVGGMTEAALAGVSAGSFDAFVVKVDKATLLIAP